MRKAFIKVIREELATNDSLAVFLGDISVAGFLNAEDELIERVYNCGILEQGMVSFAAGCSANGIYPVVQTIVPFIVERAFEQIKLDFCSHGYPGLLVGVGGGLEYSKLGYTHHTLWDTAILANLEGLTLYTPTTGASEVRHLLPKLIHGSRLAYARLTECYLSAEERAPLELEALTLIKRVPGCRKAVIVCGAFPGIQEFVARAEVDVYAYSFPNSLPRNISDLICYEHLDIWEFGTAPLLARTLRPELPSISMTAHHQRARFFRHYGTESAAEFISENWVSES